MSVCQQVLDAARNRGDDHMIRILENGSVDLIAKKAVYHHSCKSSYTDERNIRALNSNPTIKQDLEESLFDKLIAHIHADLFFEQKKTQYPYFNIKD